jgi:hypothetical protein
MKRIETVFHVILIKACRGALTCAHKPCFIKGL